MSNRKKEQTRRRWADRAAKAARKEISQKKLDPDDPTVREELTKKHFGNLPHSVRTQIGLDYFDKCMGLALPHRPDLVERLDAVGQGQDEEFKEIFNEIVEEARRRGVDS